MACLQECGVDNSTGNGGKNWCLILNQKAVAMTVLSSLEILEAVESTVFNATSDDKVVIVGQLQLPRPQLVVHAVYH